MFPSFKHQNKTYKEAIGNFEHLQIDMNVKQNYTGNSAQDTFKIHQGFNKLPIY